MTSLTGTTDEKLTWLIEGLLERTPGARHALVLSRDGLKLCRTPELSVDQADQLSAIAAGIQSLSYGASMKFGDGSGGVRSAMAEFYGGVLFIVEAGEGAHLAVVTDEDADAGLVGHTMSELVEQLGERLSARPRGATSTATGAQPSAAADMMSGSASGGAAGVVPGAAAGAEWGNGSGTAPDTSPRTSPS